MFASTMRQLKIIECVHSIMTLMHVVHITLQCREKHRLSTHTTLMCDSCCMQFTHISDLLLVRFELANAHPQA